MNRTIRRMILLAVITLLAAVFIFGLGFLRQTFLSPNWKIRRVPPSEVINFVLYTVDQDVLNLTAHLYELEPEADRTVRLQIKENGRWREIAATEIVEPEYIAPFQIRRWDDSREVPYRVRHGEQAVYPGLIRANPVEKDQLVVAAFTCNGNSDRGPRPDVIANIKALDPDLLFFSGDQVYDHQTHFVSFHLFGRQFGEITRDRPTVVIPDDHDVGNPNLWGAGGRIGFGGYQDPGYVNQVQNQQTSHLPDPYDPTPIQRGITTYYTSLTWGRIGFAILEDRKWKSQIDLLDRAALEEAGVVFSRPDHVEKLPDPDLLDHPEGTLLGDRQLVFLEDWAANWEDQEMKAVLHQAPLAGTAHLHGPSRVKLAADLDANGWPQSGRDRALRAIRKGFAVMINGDTHLATFLHQGVDQHGDAGYSFSVPAVVSIYRRWWSPDQAPPEKPTGELAYTGPTRDPFGNLVDMIAYANPNPTRLAYDRWKAQGAGFGVIRFQKSDRTITLELWPRGCLVTDPACSQYPGWPVTINQLDNYGRTPEAYLPNLRVSGRVDPVVQVRTEPDGEILYTLRIKGTQFQPWVFEEGTYTIQVASGGDVQLFRGIKAADAAEAGELTVEFPERENLP
jgi:hypothetical protein